MNRVMYVKCLWRLLVVSIAIIPARGGSKRIPRKNIKDFHGKPLIAYSIEKAVDSGLFEDVYVSTDDDEIAKVSQSYGAKVIHRPKELADDFTGTQEVVKHALSVLERKYDFCCTIYATAPLLQVNYLKEGFERLKDSNAKMAFSVTSMPFPIQRTFKITDDGRCEMFWKENFSKRSQDLEEAFQDAGQFYWERLDRESKDILFGSDSIPIVLPRYLVQDIDTLEDWKRAEKLYKLIYPNIFDEWNDVKQEVDNKKQIIGFRERDILFLSIGQNVGFEVYGKGDEFLRPVLVLKKFSRFSFFGIPLSTRFKEGRFYFNFNYKKDIVSTALLTQAKIFDVKRAKYRSGKINKNDFDKLVKKFTEVITPLSEKRGSA